MSDGLAMSDTERNAALVRAGIEAFNRGDQSAVIDLLDERVESVVGPGLANAGIWHGREGYVEMVSFWGEAWGELEFEVVGLETPDERHAVAEVHQRAVGAGSGVPVEMTVFFMFEVRAERLLRLHIYADRDAAGEAVAASPRE
jgi:ketosteroid isomerase-like protein